MYHTELKDLKQLSSVADTLQKTVQDFRLLLGEGNLRGNWREILRQSAVEKSFKILVEKLAFLSEVIKLALGRSQALDNILNGLKI
ncbi:helicase, ATP-dependent, c2 type [Rodentibacter pneumotropicus]|uniref:Helicase, ATP-dependent, c2 type n=1 Tax=Rodentibacter pneumotropicus TaxID=758 RepID=A0A3S4Y0Y9_9PAST|nr:helicase, ATP-dependent, c2 type [Rodentibacter pneumotropicus]